MTSDNLNKIIYEMLCFAISYTCKHKAVQLLIVVFNGPIILQLFLRKKYVILFFKNYEAKMWRLFLCMCTVVTNS